MEVTLFTLWHVFRLSFFLSLVSKTQNQNKPLFSPFFFSAVFDSLAITFSRELYAKRPIIWLSVISTSGQLCFYQSLCCPRFHHLHLVYTWVDHSWRRPMAILYVQDIQVATGLQLPQYIYQCATRATAFALHLVHSQMQHPNEGLLNSRKGRLANALSWYARVFPPSCVFVYVPVNGLFVYLHTKILDIQM